MVSGHDEIWPHMLSAPSPLVSTEDRSAFRPRNVDKPRICLELSAGGLPALSSTNQLSPTTIDDAGLLLTAHSQHLQVANSIAGPRNWLVGRVDYDLRCCIEVHRNIVCLTVGGLDTPRHVSHWPGQHFEVLRQPRVQKCQ